MNGLREDLRHAMRVFWNAPSFAAAAALTLALGMGVNIAVFTVMHAALLARLPVTHAKDLVSVYSWSPKGGDHLKT